MTTTLAALFDQLDPEARETISEASFEACEADLRYLGSLSPEKQRRCADLFARFGGPLGDGIRVDGVTTAPASDVADEVEVAEVRPMKSTGTTSPREGAGGRYTKVVNLADIKPNKVNAATFDVSLGDESIGALAEDQERHGDRQQIEVNENDIILDGERRWLSKRKRGVTKDTVVVVPGVTTDEQIEEYVYDAYASIRSPSIDERVRLYDLASAVLSRRHGRPRGRPRKRSSDEDLFWSPAQVRQEAARQAGFPSDETARRAAKVLREADHETQADLRSGRISINGVYSRLRKQQKAAESTAKTDDAETQTEMATEGAPEGSDAEEAADDDANVAANPFDPDLYEPEEPEPEDDDPEEPEDECDDASQADIALPWALDDDWESDPWETLEKLGRRVVDRFEAVVVGDYDRAAEWHEQHLDALGCILSAAQPDDDE